MALYLDASVLVPLAVEEASSVEVERFLKSRNDPLVVSEFAAVEAASGVSRLVRMEQMTVEQGLAALEDLDAWRFTSSEQIDVTPGDFRHAHALVRRFETHLRAADAMHVAVARRLGAVLVSRDAGMIRAAEMVGLVAVDPATAK